MCGVVAYICNSFRWLQHYLISTTLPNEFACSLGAIADYYAKNRHNLSSILARTMQISLIINKLLDTFQKFFLESRYIIELQ